MDHDGKPPRAEDVPSVSVFGSQAEIEKFIMQEYGGRESLLRRMALQKFRQMMQTHVLPDQIEEVAKQEGWYRTLLLPCKTNAYAELAEEDDDGAIVSPSQAIAAPKSTALVVSKPRPPTVRAAVRLARMAEMHEPAWTAVVDFCSKTPRLVTARELHINISKVMGMTFAAAQDRVIHPMHAAGDLVMVGRTRAAKYQLAGSNLLPTPTAQKALPTKQ
jgi:hypothetical protein